ncbi:hypothetical protein GCM10023238_06350 [Streptomyces heliomycini]
MTDVSIEEHPVAGGGPYAITTGPDGALWYTLVHSGGIGRMVPGAEPVNHRLDPDCGPTFITSGPDGALWFTEYRAHRIGRITTDGTVAEFPLPTPDCGPSASRRAPTGRCGSPRPPPTASVASPPAVRSPSSRSRPPARSRPRSPRGRTGGCGSP